MPLSSIFSGQEGNSIVLLTDCQRQPAFILLKAHVIRLAALVDTVHVYLYETRQDKLLNDLPNSVLPRIQIHDLLRDPLGWGEQAGDASSPDTVIGHPFPKCAYNNRYSIVIDSLSAMLHYTSVHQVCQWFHSLSGRKSQSHSGNQSGCRQVIAIVHTDLHPRSAIQMLEHTADIVVSLDATEPSRCKVVEKSRNGKKLPRITHEIFTIDQYFNVRSEIVVSSSKSNAAAAPVSTKSPAAAMSKLTDNLTFNSTVSRAESEARSRLILPYVHTGQAGTVVGGGGDGGEEFMLDDDEEDPDDDLDI